MGRGRKLKTRDEETKGCEGAKVGMWEGLRDQKARDRVLRAVEVGKFEGKSAPSRFSIKNEGILIDEALFG